MPSSYYGAVPTKINKSIKSTNIWRSSTPKTNSADRQINYIYILNQELSFITNYWIISIESFDRITSPIGLPKKLQRFCWRFRNIIYYNLILTACTTKNHFPASIRREISHLIAFKIVLEKKMFSRSNPKLNTAT